MQRGSLQQLSAARQRVQPTVEAVNLLLSGVMAQIKTKITITTRQTCSNLIIMRAPKMASLVNVRIVTVKTRPL